MFLHNFFGEIVDSIGSGQDFRYGVYDKIFKCALFNWGVITFMIDFSADTFIISYSDGSHYIAVPHSARFNTRRRKAVHKEIIVDENLKDNSEPVTITTPKGEILTESEFICGELVPVMRRVKGIGTRTTKKAVFEKLYKENIFEKRKVMRKKIISAMEGLFENASAAENYVDDNLERKRRNLICRRVRMTRKVNLQTFDYFCTFTYDDKKHTEISFRKKLTWTFANLSHRKGWKYVGV